MYRCRRLIYMGVDFLIKKFATQVDKSAASTHVKDRSNFFLQCTDKQWMCFYEEFVYPFQWDVQFIYLD
jgi:hypothetical protein